MFSLWLCVYVCACLYVCDWRKCCDSNHEARSDPARSLSGFASFSSQGIFGIVVSDTLIVMGRPGCQWSAWISILPSSPARASATWCKPSLSWQRSCCPLTHQVAYLWAGVQGTERSFYLSVQVKCSCNLRGTAFPASLNNPHCSVL